MKIETYTQRVLIPSNGMWLCNEKDKVISDKVFLGVNALESDWVEITEKEKDALQKQWEPEESSEILEDE